VILAVITLFTFAGIMLAYWYFGSEHYEVTGIPILNYHEVDNTFHTCLTMTPHDFSQQMQYLKDQGYHTITPAQLNDYLTKGTALPDKPVMITFDDGYVDNYTDAYPILKKYDMTGTIFIITSLVGKPGYLSWAQIKKMDKDNMAFGSHTITHRPLSELDENTVRQELTTSKQQIETQLGHSIHFIAYPEGKYNTMVERETKAAGYAGAFTVNAGRLHAGDDPYALNRVAIFEGNNSFTHFRIRLLLSTLCGYLWKWHAFFYTTLHLEKLASLIPQP